MAFRIQVRSTGISKAKLATLKKGKRFQNLKPVLKWAADRVEGDTAKRFKRRGNYDGVITWAPLSSSTIRRKSGNSRLLGSPSTPLVETGKLIRATQKGGKGHLRRVTNKTAYAGVNPSTVPYYKYHQDGDGVPQRVFLHWGPASDRLFLKKLMQYLKTGKKP